MNFYTCLELINSLELKKLYNINHNNVNEKSEINPKCINDYDFLKNIYFYATNDAKRIGTTANLVEGMYVSIYDLFYGLMLPSGNDAAYMLGENFGTLLYMKQSK